MPKISDLINMITKKLVDDQIKEGLHKGGWKYHLEKEPGAMPNPLNTGEVLFGLFKTDVSHLRLKQEKNECIQEGIKYILKHQLPSGGWGHTTCYLNMNKKELRKFRGNIVSTYFASKSLAFYIDSNQKLKKEIQNALAKVIRWIKTCIIQNEGVAYSPAHLIPRKNACIYAILTYFSIASLNNLDNKNRNIAQKEGNKLLKSFCLSSVVDGIIKPDENLEDYENKNELHNVTNILFCLLKNKKELIDNEVSTHFELIYRNALIAIQNFTFEELKENVVECQKINKKDRRFNHLICIWAMIVNLESNNPGEMSEFHNLLKYLLEKNRGYLGEIYIPTDKAAAWAGGLYLLFLSALQKNFDIHDYLKKEL